MARLNDKTFSKIEPGKIKAGKFFSEGSYGSRKRLGLKGQLSQIKFTGQKGATANVSSKNLSQFYNLISQRLKSKTKHFSAFLSRRDSKKIMGAAESTRKTDKSFTSEDKKDLKSIVDTIRIKQRQQINRRPTDTLDLPVNNRSENLVNTQSSNTPNIQLTRANLKPNKSNKDKTSNPEVSTPEKNNPSQGTMDLDDLDTTSAINADEQIPKATEAKDLPLE